MIIMNFKQKNQLFIIKSSFKYIILPFLPFINKKNAH